MAWYWTLLAVAGIWFFYVVLTALLVHIVWRVAGKYDPPKNLQNLLAKTGRDRI